MNTTSICTPFFFIYLFHYAPTVQQVRHGGDHRTMPLTASRWQWHKFKDMVHYYIMLGAIPLSLVVLYANIFIGPAQLSEIPEDYVPKHWEYYRVIIFCKWNLTEISLLMIFFFLQHPIQRFFARYVYTNPQQEYEKYMHILYEEEEKRQLRYI
jgi:NADH dehydrogenase (ubiquinone) 1 beta subcomplex subunit 5